MDVLRYCERENLKEFEKMAELNSDLSSEILAEIALDTPQTEISAGEFAAFEARLADKMEEFYTDFSRREAKSLNAAGELYLTD